MHLYLEAYTKVESVEGVVQPDGFVQIEPRPSTLTDGKIIENAAMFLIEWQLKHPECVGRMVKLTIELVPTPEETAAAQEAAKAYLKSLNQAFANQIAERFREDLDYLLGRREPG